MTEILLDYDGRLPARLLDRVGRLARLVGRKVLGLSFARSARGWHVRVILRDALEPLEVVCWQLVLGSDVERETFNLKRALVLRDAPPFWRQKGRWNVFYRRKL